MVRQLRGESLSFLNILTSKIALTFIELVIVMVIIGIISIIAIPNISRSYILANDSAAEANLRTIASALENYSVANNGSYPTAESSLTSSTPPYLNQSFCGQTIRGYTYSCTLNTNSYSVTATASTCGQTGTKSYTITTGGVLTTNNCS